MGPGGGACVSARRRLHQHPLPVPGSIGCERASCPVRSMQLVQVFTGIPFLDTTSMIKRHLVYSNVFKSPHPAAPARHVSLLVNELAALGIPIRSAPGCRDDELGGRADGALTGVDVDGTAQLTLMGSGVGVGLARGLAEVCGGMPDQRIARSRPASAIASRHDP